MEFDQIDPGLYAHINRLSEIPNSPFLYEPSLRHVASRLSSFGIPRLSIEDAKNEQVGYTIDDLGLYLKFKRGNPQNKLIFTTHLDHPFFVVGQNLSAYPVGSLEPGRILAKTPLRIYSREGEYIGLDYVRSSGRTFKLAGETKPSQNSHGLWNINPSLWTNEKLKLISADDVVTTAVCLQLADEIFQNHTTDIDVEFVFTFVEEVRQVSATGIALRGKTPFGKIDTSTLIVPLECDYTEISPELRENIKSAGFQTAENDAGLIIRVNDSEIVYGQEVFGNNLAEALIMKASENTGVKHQHALMGSSCDGTSFSLFSKTPSIASITIPTRFKHNYGPQGEIVHEEIWLDDLVSLKSVMKEMVQLGATSPTPTLENQLSQSLKKSELVASPSAIRALKRDRLSAFLSSSQRLMRGKYLPDNTSDRLFFIMGGLNARLNKVLAK